MRAGLLAFLLLLINLTAPSIAAEPAKDTWSFALVVVGLPQIVMEGTASLAIANGRLAGQMTARDRDVATISGRLSANAVTAALNPNNTDAGPMALKGKLISDRLPDGSTLQTIWLLDERSGHYLVFSRQRMAP